MIYKINGTISMHAGSDIATLSLTNDGNKFTFEGKGPNGPGTNGNISIDILAEMKVDMGADFFGTVTHFDFECFQRFQMAIRFTMMNGENYYLQGTLNNPAYNLIIKGNGTWKKITTN